MEPRGQQPDEPVFEAQAELDLPGETGRQARIFAVWAVCLLLAVVVSASVGAHVSFEDEGSLRAERELRRSRVAKAKVAFVLGLVVPVLLTLGLDARYKRRGG